MEGNIRAMGGSLSSEGVTPISSEMELSTAPPFLATVAPAPRRPFGTGGASCRAYIDCLSRPQSRLVAPGIAEALFGHRARLLAAILRSF